MEALVPAFIAVFLAEFNGASQRTAQAMLATGRPWWPLLALLILVMAGSAIAGLLIAPVMPIVARGLLVGLALLAAGLPLLFKAPTADPVPGYGRLAMRLFGAGGPFIVFALAARTDMPVLATLGGVLGGVAVFVPQALADRPLRRILPLPAIRMAAAALLVLAGGVIALSALGLI